MDDLETGVADWRIDGSLIFNGDMGQTDGCLWGTDIMKRSFSHLVNHLDHAKRKRNKDSLNNVGWT